MKRTLIITAICLAAGCSKVDYVPDNPYANIPTIVLMHRGNGWNTEFTENTLPGALYGFSVLDGVELDIQISESGTLWLDHGNEVLDCNGAVVGCFSQMTDDEIEVYNDCEGKVSYYTLESVFAAMVTQYPEKYISLDIKTQYCDISATAEEMQRMADAVLALVIKYGLQGGVLAESSSINFLERISEENAPVGQALIVLEDLDQGLSDAYKLKARAISYSWEAEEQLTVESVELIHQKGFGAIIWVVNEPADIAEAWRMKPDVIETDNPEFRKYIPND